MKCDPRNPNARIHILAGDMELCIQKARRQRPSVGSGCCRMAGCYAWEFEQSGTKPERIVFPPSLGPPGSAKAIEGLQIQSDSGENHRVATGIEESVASFRREGEV